MAVENTAQAIALIKGWMQDRKVFKCDSSDKNAERAYFSFEGACNSGVNFTIQQPKDMVRVVGVTTRILFDPVHLQKLAALNQQKREKFFRGLNKSLMLIPPSSVYGPEGKPPEWIFFIKEISYDELTEGRLMEALEQVNRAVLLTSSIFLNEFGESKTE